MESLTEREKLMLAAIEAYVELWNSSDLTSRSQAAAGRRMRMWEKIDAALEACGKKRN